jgi:hypothetical protein
MRRAHRAFKKKNFTRRRKQSGGSAHSHSSDLSILGQGRSTSIYIEPEVFDTAVLIAFFNPAKFRRSVENARYIIKIMKDKKIPCYVAECVFDKAAQQIPDADLVLHSNSYMFYKEQLFNKLEKLVPEQYTKLVALDADIMFDAPDWIDQVSLSLNTHDIIQPYLKACWLSPDNKRVRSWKYGQSYALLQKIPITSENIHEYHPGFAWAFRRDIFRKLGGFYPNAIIGGGDALFTFNFYPTGMPRFWVDNQEGGAIHTIIEQWPKYNENFKHVNPKLGHLNIKCFHLFHGLMIKRQYDTRYSLFSKDLTGKWNDVITYNKDGLTEFVNPHLRKILYKYFKDRDEDVPLSTVMDTRKGKRPTLTTINQDTKDPVLD